MSLAKVTITLMSEGNNGEAAVAINFDPPFTQEELDALGFYPEAFRLLDNFIVPALEAAFEEADEVEDLTETRRLN